MRNYLKKLGSRKFQTYLVFTICNIITAYLTWTGAVDVNAQLQGWMPLINGVGQLVAGAVYTWVEGKVDKANAVANSDPGESYH